jgi:hypothetical protein
MIRKSISNFMFFSQDAVDLSTKQAVDRNAENKFKNALNLIVIPSTTRQG